MGERRRSAHDGAPGAPEANALRGLDSIKLASAYPKGVMLFVEGQLPRGVYVVCSGQVKLSTSSGEARVPAGRATESSDAVINS